MLPDYTAEKISNLESTNNSLEGLFSCTNLVDYCLKSFLSWLMQNTISLLVILKLHFLVTSRDKYFIYISRQLVFLLL